MYFNAETQSRVISRLGFALRPKGVLFLGKAEMLLNHTAVFHPIDLRDGSSSGRSRNTTSRSRRRRGGSTGGRHTPSTAASSAKN